LHGIIFAKESGKEILSDFPSIAWIIPALHLYSLFPIKMPTPANFLSD
jgi:hypothetical protein